MKTPAIKKRYLYKGVRIALVGFLVAAGGVLVPHTTHAGMLFTLPPDNLGIVAHWTFDGSTISGTSVSDVSGLGNTGTMVGGPTPTIGKLGQALSFDGSTQYVSGTAGLGSLNGASAATISAWVYFTAPASSSYYTVLTFDSGSTIPYSLYVRNYNYSNVNFTLTTTAGRVNLPVANNVTNGWHLITGTYDGSFMKLYVDGQYVSEVAETGTITKTGYGTQETYIGSGGTSSGFFPGKIDDVRLYTRALSGTEVKQLYNLGAVKHGLTPTNALTSGLIGHWTFDGPTVSGTTAQDVSGNGNTATLVNGPTPTTGAIGQALNFDGTNQYATLPNTIAPTAITISLWVKSVPGSIGQYNQLFGGGVGYFHIWTRDSTATKYFYWEPSSAGYILSTTPIENTWQFVTVTTGPGGSKLYINGVEEASDATLTTVTGSNTTQIAGYQAYDPGRTWTGNIDDVRVYDRVLSSTAIKQLYNLGAVKHDISPTNALANGLVGYWTFDGPTISGTTVADVSGTGNNATMANSPTLTLGKLGQAVTLNGTNQNITVSNPTGLPTGSAQRTYATWFKASNYPASGTGAELMGLGGNSATGDRLGFWVSNGTECTGYAIGVEGQSIGIFYPWTPDHKWHEIVVAYPPGQTNISQAEVYLDGSRLTTTCSSIAGTLNTTSAALSIGNVPTTAVDYFSGTVDDVRIYNRALSATEVKQLYNLGK